MLYCNTVTVATTRRAGAGLSARSLGRACRRWASAQAGAGRGGAQPEVASAGWAAGWARGVGARGSRGGRAGRATWACLCAQAGRAG